ncbi:MAG: ADP-ribosylglycohydrolase family protein [Dehalococcoidia bacterium]
MSDRPASLPRLYLNWIADFDWLIALEFGRVDDGQPAENWERVSEAFGYLHEEPGGGCVGFKVLGFSTFDPEEEAVASIWDGPRFDVPVLGLADASAGEIALAARALFGSEGTVNRQFFSAATDARGEEALALWLACLQAGDSMAHFGLGYTLFELGRFPEAYRHLRHYTEIAPEGAWNWCWRGKAAAAIGETDEAEEAWEKAVELEGTTGEETDAPELLAELREAYAVAEGIDGKEAFGDRVAGCLLGGAIGDALGAPVEFMDRARIDARFGDQGVRDYAEEDGAGRITDDTQMTLFTAEGLIRSRVRAIDKGICHEPSVIDHAYARWSATQGSESSRWGDWEIDGWLIERNELWARRAPGNTCLSGLRAPQAGTTDQPINDSKGCGALMRAAPLGLVPFWDAETRFRLGAETGALTHGHPSGYLAAGFLAAAVGALIEGSNMPEAIGEARRELVGWEGHEELLRAVDAAVGSAREHGMPDADQIEEFGAGWIAEEALGIALWVSLCAEDPREALVRAVSHAGDSDSTGAITGNLVGAAVGLSRLPGDLIGRLVERDVVRAVAADVVALLGPRELELTDEIRDRYPGW